MSPLRAPSGISESVIRLMTRKAIQYNAINLSQGFPNEPPPRKVVEALAHGALGGTPQRATDLKLLVQGGGADVDVLNQYSMPMGRPELRKAVSDFYDRMYDYSVDWEEQITITLGATEAMASALRTIGQPGDKILILEPFHELYPSQCQIFYLEPIYVTLREQTNGKAGGGGHWEINWDEMKEAMKQARAFILNSPHNPTGKVFTREELQRIVEMALKYDTFILTDEIYEFMCYNDTKHYCLPKEFPEITDRLFLCNSISKSCSATGWRVGWCIHPEEFSNFYRGVHDQMVVMSPHPMQFATETYLELPNEFFTEDLPVRYLSRLEMLAYALKSAGFLLSDPDGAYYLFAKYKKVPALFCLSPMDAAMFMIQEIGVACVPGDNFYGKDMDEGGEYLRFAACRSLSDVQMACERLKKLNEYA